MSKAKNKNIEAIYPLSPMQQGMLFHYVYNPESATYFEQFSVKLKGQIDRAAFEYAWNMVVQRHAVLRTSFVWKKLDRMLQVVQRKVEIPFIALDWRNVPASDQTAKLEEYAAADRRKGFNLAKAPLLRFHLIQLEDDFHQFIWSFHHLLADGWSIPILLKEAFMIYEMKTQGKAIQLPPARPYKEYINWLQKQDMAKAQNYWSNLLQGFMPVSLPFIRQRGQEINTPEMRDKKIMDLPADVFNKLKNLAAESQLTMNTVVQTAWGLLLSRFTRQSEALFGATVSGRPPEIPGVENMVGLFINSLPVRVQFDEKQSLRELLKAVQRQALNTREFEFTPLVEIQGWAKIPRDLPMFDTLVVFENYPVDSSMKSAKTSMEISEISSFEKSNFPLSLIATQSQTLSVKLAFERRYVEESMAENILKQLEHILTFIAEQPNAPIAALPLMNETERNKVLNEWNNREIPFEENLCIHKKFEQTAAAQPDDLAVNFKGRKLTFKELNERANQLAHYLIEAGVKAEMPVGICLDRSLEMMISILGILKAGGAYVPMEPTYPEERLAYTVKDAGLQIILTLKNNATALANLAVQSIALDEQWPEISKHKTDNPQVDVKPENLCYIIYTSGSTGKPKGVMIQHRSVLNLAANLNEIVYKPVSSGKMRISMNAPIIFDASMQRMIMMMHGHSLHIIPEEIRGSGKEMVNFIRENKIQFADGVPSQLKLMLEDGLLENSQWKPLTLLTGGEALDFNLWQKIQADNDIVFFNMYGPTECTVDASITPVRPAGNKPTIGRALANSRFYIVNKDLEPVPIGVPGELCVSGENLARGYLNRPDLTAGKFIPDPFSDRPGSRMYRTGDLVCMNANGNVEFLGRVDFQVKLRGFRIELGEIETALLRHPQIKDALVILREDVADNKYLAAYIISENGAEINRDELRAFIKKDLPDYMAPATYTLLDAFPLLPNGKINRRALPQPQESDMSSAEKIAPRTPVEELLASIWKDVLKVENIGANDNFFDLGGHSLLATQMVSRIRDAFDVEMELKDIFEAPLLSALALKIEELRLKDSALKQPPLEPVPRDGDLLPSFAQQRLWFLDQLAPGQANYNVPTTIILKGQLNLDILKQCMETVVQRHESLRTTFTEKDGDPLQVIHDTVEINLPLVDISDLPEDERKEKAAVLAKEEAATPFDLAKGPLFRVQLVRLAEQEHLALINLHHIITDGWSSGVLIQEIARLYNAFIKEEPSPLPDLPVQYADYAAWQRNWLQGEVLEKQLAFWKEYIGQNPPVLELPTDNPRPAMQTFNGRSIRWDLPKDLSQKVSAFCRKEGATMFMTLLAAFQTLLHRYTSQQQILVGSPIANRNRSETEKLIGFFVNTLVFKADFSEISDFKSLLQQVRENTLQAYAHQDLPFEQLVEALQPQRDMSHSPLFQAAFILQNAPFERFDLEGLTIEPFMAENPTAKYDLTLYTSETDDGLVCFWEYNTDLFRQETIERMMGHFQNLLDAIMEEPKQKIGAYDFLTDADKKKLFREWNATEQAYPQDKTVHEIFESLVETQGESLATQFADQKLSYAELNAKANQLAHYLRGLGLQADNIVGICLPRSMDVPVTVLGIMKAGGAFMAIDPNYPQERIAYMIQDSGLKYIITTEELASVLPLNGTPVIRIDSERDKFSAMPAENLVPVSTAQNLAYVIYTSGSTGKPKGTMLAHSGLINLSRAQQKAFSIKQNSRVLQFASLSFDASAWETVMALLNGASLILTDQETLTTGQGLLSVLHDQQVSTVTLPPSVLAVMPEEELPHLKTIITAGEKCTLDLVQRWGQNRQFVNAYGPTETTVCASMFDTVANKSIDPPIGAPIDNFQLYILDENWQPVPIGVPGELCIAGAGLARGYLNRPALTAAAFIPNPFSAEPGSRLYRSGDLVRWLPDGNIDFLGRIDHQVKLRGFRIELGEIEAVLTNHEKIRDAAALVRSDSPGEQRLVAYYVTEDSEPLVSNQIKNYLKEQLPEYMIPAVFMHLESMPLTPNLKVDRKALPVPEQTREALETEFVAPRNEQEEKLTEIVAGLLNIEKVGVYDNFFDLGGHSLLATKFMSRIREQFSVELPLRILFEKPTVAELAEAILQTKSASAEETIEHVERDAESLEELLAGLDEMSDEEARALLEEEENKQNRE